MKNDSGEADYFRDLELINSKSKPMIIRKPLLNKISYELSKHPANPHNSFSCLKRHATPMMSNRYA